ncbi:MAG: CidA/LrgA family protein [Inquilinus sp.]|nr:CidA/LrgA family protein [Inquilinus sp.]
MLAFLTLLLCCQLAGELIVALVGLPLPGPVVGMALLFAGLLVRGGVPEALQSLAGGLLQHLSLLFVPAGVGVMLHLSLISDEWLAISLSLVLSTAITVAVTAGVMVGLRRLSPSPGDDGEGDR